MKKEKKKDTITWKSLRATCESTNGMSVTHSHPQEASLMQNSLTFSLQSPELPIPILFILLICSELVKDFIHLPL